MPSFTSSKFLLVGAALLGLANSSALPAKDLFSRQSTTPDGTCGVAYSGAGNGYRCPTTSSRCCSQWGWCGDSSDHCGSGCQSGYGSCGSTTTTPSTTTTTTPTTPTTPTSTPTNPGGVRPRPGNVPYGQIITDCKPGYVALTFDDGPYIYTSRLLDILQSNGVHGTFFVNGQNWGDPITSSANQAVVQRMISDGHQVGSHTWNHPFLSSLSDADKISQMTQVESALMSIIGKYPTYMRPPYFDCDSSCLSVMNDLSYHVINTNLDTFDYDHIGDIQTSRDIFSNAISSANPANSGFIVLAHDVHQTTVEGLVQSMIDTIRSYGYGIITVGECLNDPSENWYRV